MNGDIHVPFCESAGMQLPRATHLVEVWWRFHGTHTTIGRTYHVATNRPPRNNPRKKVRRVASTVASRPLFPEESWLLSIHLEGVARLACGLGGFLRIVHEFDKA